MDVAEAFLSDVQCSGRAGPVGVKAPGQDAAAPGWLLTQETWVTFQR